MPCATIRVVGGSPQPQPQPTIPEGILPIVAILGAAAIAYYLRKR